MVSDGGELEQVIDYFQRSAKYAGTNPNWTKDNGQPYYIFPSPNAEFGSIRISYSPKRVVITVLSDNSANIGRKKSGGGTACKGTGKTIQEAIDSLLVDYGRYVKRYLPKLD